MEKSLLEKLLQEYVNSFTEKEKKAYFIASSHLGSSFSLEKSLGFLQWSKSQMALKSPMTLKSPMALNPTSSS